MRIVERTGSVRGVLALEYIARGDCAGLVPFSNDATNTAGASIAYPTPPVRSTDVDATIRVAVDRYDGLLRRLAD
jgi:hypothetical protein